MAVLADPRRKVLSIVSEVAQHYHFAPLEEGPSGNRLMHKNLIFMALTYLLNCNHVLVGEPGWGKTTGAKIMAAKLSGHPYDLLDFAEVRGHPQQFVEKIVARPDYGALSKGTESVIWQGSFGPDVFLTDEINRLALDSQEAILQGVDTGRWNYLNATIFEGKKPAFMTMNERDGDNNGLLPALKDRIDIVTEEGFFTTMIVFDLEDAKRRVRERLCHPEYTQQAVDVLRNGFPAYKTMLQQRPVAGYITAEEKADIQERIKKVDFDNEAMLFLQAFMAEINFSAQYGVTRASDLQSPHTHDKTYAGVNVKHSFSPRSAMSALAYAKALAWLFEESLKLEHVMYVLPHVFALKASFSDDYKDAHGQDIRKDMEMIHLAKMLVKDVYDRYVKSIQIQKNFIAEIQADGMSDADLAKINENDHDHPLMIDLIKQVKAMRKRAFYESE